DKDRQEEIIKNSGLDWTIARPAMLTHGTKTGNYKAITKLKRVKAKNISRADVADFMLNEIEQKNYLHQTPLLTY
ncbi:MAG: NAD(P)-dependent oxidoreductase, partial [Thermodesulfobacteriota bacterium]